MIRFARLGFAFFSRITPQVIPQLKERLRRSRQLVSLKEYLTPPNIEQIFDVVVAAELPRKEANKALEDLAAMCSAQDDLQINVLANIFKQLAINDARGGDTAAAISHFQQALSTISLMDSPNQLSQSQIYKFIADLAVQINEFKKAEESLRESEHLLLGLEDDGQQLVRSKHSGLACVYTQLGMIKYRQRKPIEALEQLQKALSHWQQVPNKIIQEYELTCRLQCMLHLLFRQKDQALTAAKHFLKELEGHVESTKKIGISWTLSRLYFMNIICMFQQNKALEGQIQTILKDFKEKRGEEKLVEMMVMVGIKPGRYAQ